MALFFSLLSVALNPSATEAAIATAPAAHTGEL